MASRSTASDDFDLHQALMANFGVMPKVYPDPGEVEEVGGP